MLTNPTVQALKKSRLPQNLQMVVLCNRPNFEFRAFQVMQPGSDVSCI